MDGPVDVTGGLVQGRSDAGALSPLSGSYLLIVIGEPQSHRDKELILSKITKGFLSWDEQRANVDLHKELQTIADLGLEGEEQRGGERLIQYATENLVAEVLIQPQVNTLQQCLRNLLSSFTKHRHIIHAGHAFAGNGSWILQDGTFSFADLAAAFSEYEVQRVLHAYESCITIDIHCSHEGQWSTQAIRKESFSELCAVSVNPDDSIELTPAISAFVLYLSDFLYVQSTEELLRPSDIVGNIRFSRPTLYVFPGGQGDSALFGVNGFNMLIDGGYNRKSCFWDFTKHLDRLDSVLVTRLNTSNVLGITSVIERKAKSSVYPQVGHFFCNIAGTQKSPDADKDTDSLLINVWDAGHLLRENLRQIGLKPHLCFRDNSMEPINLYHKVGHGTLDMYVLNPSRDSKEVKEFLQRWHNEVISSEEGFVTYKIGKRSFPCPITNTNSICALIVWKPNDPCDTITRILFPGSTPQHKILEGLEKLKHLDYLKYPTCSSRSLRTSEERKVKTKEKVLIERTTKRYVSQSPPIRLKSDRHQRSQSSESRRQLDDSVQERNKEILEESKKQKRIQSKRKQQLEKEQPIKSGRELKDKKDKINGEIGIKSIKSTDSNISEINGTDLTKFEDPTRGLSIIDEQVRLDALEEPKESSLLSVESGIILADDRESSLEVEQTKVIGDEHKSNDKSKDILKTDSHTPIRVITKEADETADANINKLTEGHHVRQPAEKSTTSEIKDTSKSEKIGSKDIKKSKPDSTKKDKESKIIMEHKKSDDRKSLTKEKNTRKEVLKTSQAESSEAKKRMIKKTTSKEETRISAARKPATKQEMSPAKKPIPKKTDVTTRATKLKNTPKSLPKQGKPEPIRPRGAKPKPVPADSSKEDGAVQKLISGVAVNAGVVAAAAAGLSVSEASVDPDIDEIILGGRVDLEPDPDEEDRVSDIINIPGVQEVKIEDDLLASMHKTEEDEKDSLILHEDGVTEQASKEPIDEIDPNIIQEEDEEADEPKREYESLSPRTAADLVDDDRRSDQLEIEDEEEKVSIPEKEDEAEKDIKAREEHKIEDASKMEKKGKDIEEDDREDLYATLPSSAKLTEYKEQYEEKPLRGLFTGMQVDEMQEKVMEKLQGDILKPDGEEKPSQKTPVKQDEKIGIPLEKSQTKGPTFEPREVIKTPDEVEDLPIHEEVDSIETDTYESKKDAVDDKKEETPSAVVSQTLSDKGAKLEDEEIIFKKCELLTSKPREEASKDTDATDPHKTEVTETMICSKSPSRKVDVSKDIERLVTQYDTSEMKSDLPLELFPKTQTSEKENTKFEETTEFKITLKDDEKEKRTLDGESKFELPYLPFSDKKHEVKSQVDEVMKEPVIDTMIRAVSPSKDVDISKALEMLITDQSSETLVQQTQVPEKMADIDEAYVHQTTLEDGTTKHEFGRVQRATEHLPLDLDQKDYKVEDVKFTDKDITDKDKAIVSSNESAQKHIPDVQDDSSAIPDIDTRQATSKITEETPITSKFEVTSDISTSDKELGTQSILTQKEKVSTDELTGQEMEKDVHIPVANIKEDIVKSEPKVSGEAELAVTPKTMPAKLTEPTDSTICQSVTSVPSKNLEPQSPHETHTTMKGLSKRSTDEKMDSVTSFPDDAEQKDPTPQLDEVSHTASIETIKSKDLHEDIEEKLTEPKETSFLPKVQESIKEVSEKLISQGAKLMYGSDMQPESEGSSPSDSETPREELVASPQLSTESIDTVQKDKDFLKSSEKTLPVKDEIFDEQLQTTEKVSHKADSPTVKEDTLSQLETGDEEKQIYESSIAHLDKDTHESKIIQKIDDPVTYDVKSDAKKVVCEDKDLTLTPSSQIDENIHDATKEVCKTAIEDLSESNTSKLSEYNLETIEIHKVSQSDVPKHPDAASDPVLEKSISNISEDIKVLEDKDQSKETFADKEKQDIQTSDSASMLQSTEKKQPELTEEPKYEPSSTITKETASNVDISDATHLKSEPVCEAENLIEDTKISFTTADELIPASKVLSTPFTESSSTESLAGELIGKDEKSPTSGIEALDKVDEDPEEKRHALLEKEKPSEELKTEPSDLEQKVIDLSTEVEPFLSATEPTSKTAQKESSSDLHVGPNEFQKLGEISVLDKDAKKIQVDEDKVAVSENNVTENIERKLFDVITPTQDDATKTSESEKQAYEDTYKPEHESLSFYENESQLETKPHLTSPVEVRSIPSSTPIIEEEEELPMKKEEPIQLPEHKIKLLESQIEPLFHVRMEQPESFTKEEKPLLSTSATEEIPKLSSQEEFVEKLVTKTKIYDVITEDKQQTTPQKTLESDKADGDSYRKSNVETVATRKDDLDDTKLDEIASQDDKDSTIYDKDTTSESITHISEHSLTEDIDKTEYKSQETIWEVSKAEKDLPDKFDMGKDHREKPEKEHSQTSTAESPKISSTEEDKPVEAMQKARVSTEDEEKLTQKGDVITSIATTLQEITESVSNVISDNSLISSSLKDDANQIEKTTTEKPEYQSVNEDEKITEEDKIELRPTISSVLGSAALTLSSVITTQPFTEESSSTDSAEQRLKQDEFQIETESSKDKSPETKFEATDKEFEDSSEVLSESEPKSKPLPADLIEDMHVKKPETETKLSDSAVTKVSTITDQKSTEEKYTDLDLSASQHKEPEKLETRLSETSEDEKISEKESTSIHSIEPTKFAEQAVSKISLVTQDAHEALLSKVEQVEEMIAGMKSQISMEESEYIDTKESKSVDEKDVDTADENVVSDSKKTDLAKNISESTKEVASHVEHTLHDLSHKIEDTIEDKVKTSQSHTPEKRPSLEDLNTTSKEKSDEPKTDVSSLSASGVVDVPISGEPTDTQLTKKSSDLPGRKEETTTVVFSDEAKKPKDIDESEFAEVKSREILSDQQRVEHSPQSIITVDAKETENGEPTEAKTIEKFSEKVPDASQILVQPDSSETLLTKKEKHDTEDDLRKNEIISGKKIDTSDEVEVEVRDGRMEVAIDKDKDTKEESRQAAPSEIVKSNIIDEVAEIGRVTTDIKDSVVDSMKDISQNIQMKAETAIDILKKEKMDEPLVEKDKEGTCLTDTAKDEDNKDKGFIETTEKTNITSNVDGSKDENILKEQQYSPPKEGTKEDKDFDKDSEKISTSTEREPSFSAKELQPGKDITDTKGESANVVKEQSPSTTEDYDDKLDTKIESAVVFGKEQSPMATTKLKEEIDLVKPTEETDATSKKAPKELKQEKGFVDSAKETDTFSKHEEPTDITEKHEKDDITTEKESKIDSSEKPTHTISGKTEEDDEHIVAGTTSKHAQPVSSVINSKNEENIIESTEETDISSKPGKSNEISGKHADDKSTIEAEKESKIAFNEEQFPINTESVERQDSAKIPDETGFVASSTHSLSDGRELPTKEDFVKEKEKPDVLVKQPEFEVISETKEVIQPKSKGDTKIDVSKELPSTTMKETEDTYDLLKTQKLKDLRDLPETAEKTDKISQQSEPTVVPETKEVHEGTYDTKEESSIVSREEKYSLTADNIAEEKDLQETKEKTKAEKRDVHSPVESKGFDDQGDVETTTEADLGSPKDDSSHIKEPKIDAKSIEITHERKSVLETEDPASTKELSETDKSFAEITQVAEEALTKDHSPTTSMKLREQINLVQPQDQTEIISMTDGSSDNDKQESHSVSKTEESKISKPDLNKEPEVIGIPEVPASTPTKEKLNEDTMSSKLTEGHDTLPKEEKSLGNLKGNKGDEHINKTNQQESVLTKEISPIMETDIKEDKKLVKTPEETDMPAKKDGSSIITEKPTDSNSIIQTTEDNLETTTEKMEKQNIKTIEESDDNLKKDKSPTTAEITGEDKALAEIKPVDDSFSKEAKTPILETLKGDKAFIETTEKTSATSTSETSPSSIEELKDQKKFAEKEKEIGSISKKEEAPAAFQKVSEGDYLIPVQEESKSITSKDDLQLEGQFQPAKEKAEGEKSFTETTGKTNIASDPTQLPSADQKYQEGDRSIGNIEEKDLVEEHSSTTDEQYKDVAGNSEETDIISTGEKLKEKGKLSDLGTEISASEEQLKEDKHAVELPEEPSIIPKKDLSPIATEKLDEKDLKMVETAEIPDPISEIEEPLLVTERKPTFGSVSEKEKTLSTNEELVKDKYSSPSTEKTDKDSSPTIIEKYKPDEAPIKPVQEEEIFLQKEHYQTLEGTDDIVKKAESEDATETSKQDTDAISSQHDNESQLENKQSSTSGHEYKTDKDFETTKKTGMISEKDADIVANKIEFTDNVQSEKHSTQEEKSWADLKKEQSSSEKEKPEEEKYTTAILKKTSETKEIPSDSDETVSQEEFPITTEKKSDKDKMETKGETEAILMKDPSTKEQEEFVESKDRTDINLNKNETTFTQETYEDIESSTKDRKQSSSKLEEPQSQPGAPERTDIVKTTGETEDICKKDTSSPAAETLKENKEYTEAKEELKSDLKEEKSLETLEKETVKDTEETEIGAKSLQDKYQIKEKDSIEQGLKTDQSRINTVKTDKFGDDVQTEEISLISDNTIEKHLSEAIGPTVDRLSADADILHPVEESDIPLKEEKSSVIIEKTQTYKSAPEILDDKRTFAEKTEAAPESKTSSEISEITQSLPDDEAKLDKSNIDLSLIKSSAVTEPQHKSVKDTKSTSENMATTVKDVPEVADGGASTDRLVGREEVSEKPETTNLGAEQLQEIATHELPSKPIPSSSSSTKDFDECKVKELNTDSLENQLESEMKKDSALESATYGGIKSSVASAISPVLEKVEQEKESMKTDVTKDEKESSILGSIISAVASTISDVSDKLSKEEVKQSTVLDEVKDSTKEISSKITITKSDTLEEKEETIGNKTKSIEDTTRDEIRPTIGSDSKDPKKPDESEISCADIIDKEHPSTDTIIITNISSESKPVTTTYSNENVPHATSVPMSETESVQQESGFNQEKVESVDMKIDELKEKSQSTTQVKEKDKFDEKQLETSESPSIIENISKMTEQLKDNITSTLTDVMSDDALEKTHAKEEGKSFTSTSDHEKELAETASESKSQSYPDNQTKDIKEKAEITFSKLKPSLFSEDKTSESEVLKSSETIDTLVSTVQENVSKLDSFISSVIEETKSSAKEISSDTQAAHKDSDIKSLVTPKEADEKATKGAEVTISPSKLEQEEKPLPHEHRTESSEVFKSQRGIDSMVTEEVCSSESPMLSETQNKVESTDLKDTRKLNTDSASKIADLTHESSRETSNISEANEEPQSVPKDSIVKSALEAAEEHSLPIVSDIVSSVNDKISDMGIASAARETTTQEVDLTNKDVREEYSADDRDASIEIKQHAKESEEKSSGVAELCKAKTSEKEHDKGTDTQSKNDTAKAKKDSASSSDIIPSVTDTISTIASYIPSKIEEAITYTQKLSGDSTELCKRSVTDTAEVKKSIEENIEEVKDLVSENKSSEEYKQDTETPDLHLAEEKGDPSSMSGIIFQVTESVYNIGASVASTVDEAETATKKVIGDFFPANKDSDKDPQNIQYKLDDETKYISGHLKEKEESTTTTSQDKDTAFQQHSSQSSKKTATYEIPSSVTETISSISTSIASSIKDGVDPAMQVSDDFTDAGKNVASELEELKEDAKDKITNITDQLSEKLSKTQLQESFTKSSEPSELVKKETNVPLLGKEELEMTTQTKPSDVKELKEDTPSVLGVLHDASETISRTAQSIVSDAKELVTTTTDKLDGKPDVASEIRDKDLEKAQIKVSDIKEIVTEKSPDVEQSHSIESSLQTTKSSEQATSSSDAASFMTETISTLAPSLTTSVEKAKDLTEEASKQINIADRTATEKLHDNSSELCKKIDDTTESIKEKHSLLERDQMQSESDVEKSSVTSGGIISTVTEAFSSLGSSVISSVEDTLVSEKKTSDASETKDKSFITDATDELIADSKEVEMKTSPQIDTEKDKEAHESMLSTELSNVSSSVGGVVRNVIESTSSLVSSVLLDTKESIDPTDKKSADVTVTSDTNKDHDMVSLGTETISKEQPLMSTKEDIASFTKDLFDDTANKSPVSDKKKLDVTQGDKVVDTQAPEVDTKSVLTQEQNISLSSEKSLPLQLQKDSPIAKDIVSYVPETFSSTESAITSTKKDVVDATKETYDDIKDAGKDVSEKMKDYSEEFIDTTVKLKDSVIDGISSLVPDPELVSTSQKYSLEAKTEATSSSTTSTTTTEKLSEPESYTASILQAVTTPTQKIGDEHVTADQSLISKTLDMQKGVEVQSKDLSPIEKTTQLEYGKDTDSSVELSSSDLAKESTFSESVVSAVTGTISSIGSFISSKSEEVVTAAKQKSDDIESAATHLSGKIQDLSEQSKDIGKSKSEQMKVKADQVIEQAPETDLHESENGSTHLEGTVSSISEAISDIGSASTRNKEGSVTTIESASDTIDNACIDSLAKIDEVKKEAIDQASYVKDLEMTEALQSKYEEDKNDLPHKLVSGLKENEKSVVTSILSDVTETISDIKSSVTSTAQESLSAAKKTADDIVSAEDFTPKVTSLGKEIDEKQKLQEDKSSYSDQDSSKTKQDLSHKDSISSAITETVSSKEPLKTSSMVETDVLNKNKNYELHKDSVSSMPVLPPVTDAKTSSVEEVDMQKSTATKDVHEKADSPTKHSPDLGQDPTSSGDISSSISKTISDVKSTTMPIKEELKSFKVSDATDVSKETETKTARLDKDLEKVNQSSSVSSILSGVIDAVSSSAATILGAATRYSDADETPNQVKGSEVKTPLTSETPIEHSKELEDEVHRKMDISCETSQSDSTKLELEDPVPSTSSSHPKDLPFQSEEKKQTHTDESKFLTSNLPSKLTELPTAISENVKELPSKIVIAVDGIKRSNDFEITDSRTDKSENAEISQTVTSDGLTEKVVSSFEIISSPQLTEVSRTISSESKTTDSAASSESSFRETFSSHTTGSSTSSSSCTETQSQTVSKRIYEKTSVDGTSQHIIKEKIPDSSVTRLKGKLDTDVSFLVTEPSLDLSETSEREVPIPESSDSDEGYEFVDKEVLQREISQHSVIEQPETTESQPLEDDSFLSQGHTETPKYGVVIAEKAEVVTVTPDSTAASTPITPRSIFIADDEADVLVEDSCKIPDENQQIKESSEIKNDGIKELPTYDPMTSSIYTESDMMSTSLYGEDFETYGITKIPDEVIGKESLTEEDLASAIMSTSFYGSLPESDNSYEDGRFADDNDPTYIRSFTCIESSVDRTTIDSGRPFSPKSDATMSDAAYKDTFDSLESQRTTSDAPSTTYEETLPASPVSDASYRSYCSTKDSAFDEREKYSSLESQALPSLVEEDKTLSLDLDQSKLPDESSDIQSQTAKQTYITTKTCAGTDGSRTIQTTTVMSTVRDPAIYSNDQKVASSIPTRGETTSHISSLDGEVMKSECMSLSEQPTAPEYNKYASDSTGEFSVDLSKTSSSLITRSMSKPDSTSDPICKTTKTISRRTTVCGGEAKDESDSSVVKHRISLQERSQSSDKQLHDSESDKYHVREVTDLTSTSNMSQRSSIQQTVIHSSSLPTERTGDSSMVLQKTLNTERQSSCPNSSGQEISQKEMTSSKSSSHSEEMLQKSDTRQSSTSSVETVPGSPRTGRVVVRKVTTVITKYYEDGKEVEMQEVPGSEIVEVLGNQEITEDILRKISKTTTESSNERSSISKEEPTSEEPQSLVQGQLSAQIFDSRYSVGPTQTQTSTTTTTGPQGETVTTIREVKSTTTGSQSSDSDGKSNVKAFSSASQSTEQSLMTTSSSSHSTITTMTTTSSSSSATEDPAKVLEQWGKPLGLPSPALIPPPSPTQNSVPKEKKSSKKSKKNIQPVYLDLAYVPHSANPNYCNIDFFRRVRARYYVFSGIDPGREVLDALLQAKKEWEDKNLEVTIIPTYDTDALGFWVAGNEEALIANKIDLAPSAIRCTINLQDHETSCNAYRLEF